MIFVFVHPVKPARPARLAGLLRCLSLNCHLQRLQDEYLMASMVEYANYFQLVVLDLEAEFRDESQIKNGLTRMLEKEVHCM